MKILSTPGWEEYALLDTGDGMRLEQFGKYRIVRPDPQIVWAPHLKRDVWLSADAVFNDSKKQWDVKGTMPSRFKMTYKELSFWAELTPFKHMGVFPEQILQWDWISSVIASKANQSRKGGVVASPKTSSVEAVARLERRNDVRVLNLFGYTGLASLVAAQAGATVTHVDASRPTIAWARDNQTLSGLQSKPIRWILDDVIKFVQREIKRGVKYDGIIMDPPVYGHGPNGERWEFNRSFPELLRLSRQLFSQKLLFVMINAYAISSSSLMLENVLKDFVPTAKAHIEVGELALEENGSGRLLSTGIFGRWTS